MSYRLQRCNEEYLIYFNSLIQQDKIPQSIKDEILFLLSCLHKDTSQLCVQWIEENVRDLDTFGVNGFQADLTRIDPRSYIGFALGDISMPWQNEVFKKLKANLKNDPYHALRIFAYAIWREQHFVDHFTLSECQAILNFLCKRLAWLQPRYTQQWSISKWELELLLGMLRTRNSSNEEIKMLLQPHQKITKELANQIERVTDIVIKHNIKLSSRIQLGNLPPKPKDDHTPDLLYALRLYLTGDDGANTIRITGVSDSEVDD